MSEEREEIGKEKTRISEISLILDDIIQIDFIENYVVEVADIEEIRRALLKFTKGVSFKVLVLPGKNGSISKEAQEMEMFDVPDSKIIKKVAIVTQQLHQQLLGTLFFKFKPKNYPHKLFRNKDKAINWLNKT